MSIRRTWRNHFFLSPFGSKGAFRAQTSKTSRSMAPLFHPEHFQVFLKKNISPLDTLRGEVRSFNWTPRSCQKMTIYRILASIELGETIRIGVKTARYFCSWVRPSRRGKHRRSEAAINVPDSNPKSRATLRRTTSRAILWMSLIVIMYIQCTSKESILIECLRSNAKRGPSNARKISGALDVNKGFAMQSGAPRFLENNLHIYDRLFSS